jgi:cold shock CspA family protein
MRIEGTLAKWNDDRGFGFITPTQGGPEVFVHISAFPKDGQRPRLGERLTFEMEIDKDGRKRARSIVCPGRLSVQPVRQRERRGTHEKRNLFGRIVPLALLVLAVYVYGEYFSEATPQLAVADKSHELDSSSSFQCDGRTYCSQMTSCDEATFFLRNCPNVKMDGNHDGVPCEQQWCN